MTIGFSVVSAEEDQRTARRKHDRYVNSTSRWNIDVDVLFANREVMQRGCRIDDVQPDRLP